MRITINVNPDFETSPLKWRIVAEGVTHFVGSVKSEVTFETGVADTALVVCAEGVLSISEDHSQATITAC